MSTAKNTSAGTRGKRGPYPRVWVRRSDGHETTVSLPVADYEKALALADGSARAVAAAVRHVLRAAEGEGSGARSLSAAVRVRVLARLRGLRQDPAARLAAENNAAWDAALVEGGAQC